ncbi:MAG: SH3 domain-containing protein [Treponema sp.]|nr:SH3 domain-containing protein [Treponema sp.]
MKHAVGFFIFLVVALCLFHVISSSQLAGYSMLLWDVPEHNLQDGDIVPVYIKSNISQVYVVGIPHTEDKIEVPLWKVTDPKSKHKTKKLAVQYADYLHRYAHVALDGLPVRSEPVNTSKQVYRLRKNETIKILYKGKGQPVMVGNKPLEGDWLRILTQDGTQGWCFSNNLKLFSSNETESDIAVEDEVIQEEDDTIKGMLTSRWYPSYYSVMIKSKRIDLTMMNTTYGFDTGASSGSVSLNMPDIQISWPYGGISKVSGTTYKYDDIPLQVTVKRPDFIVVRYTDQNGKPQDYEFVTIEENISDLIIDEVSRRNTELSRICQNASIFMSSNYGELTFSSDNSFMWTGYKLLVPSLIPQGAGNSGTVSIEYFMADSLKGQFDGVLTFTFDRGNKKINFLYKLEESGIRLEDLSNVVIKNKTVSSRALSPLVLFFAR